MIKWHIACNVDGKIELKNKKQGKKKKKEQKPSLTHNEHRMLAHSAQHVKTKCTHHIADIET